MGNDICEVKGQALGFSVDSTCLASQEPRAHQLGADFVEHECLRTRTCSHMRFCLSLNWGSEFMKL